MDTQACHGPCPKAWRSLRPAHPFSAHHASPGAGHTRHLLPGPSQGQPCLAAGPWAWATLSRPCPSSTFCNHTLCAWDEPPQCPRPWNGDKNSL